MSVEVTQGLELPQFNLCDIEQVDCTKTYITGGFPLCSILECSRAKLSSVLGCIKMLFKVL